MGHDIEFPETPSGAIVFEDGVAAVRTDNDIRCTIQLSPKEMLIVAILVDRMFANLRNAHVESENS